MNKKYVTVAALAVGVALSLFGGAEPNVVKVDFEKPTGAMKPVHGIGQGPLLGWIDTSLFAFLGEAGIPYARLHDVGGAFGGNRFVDVPNIFRDFDADEDDPKNYDFRFTDLYLKALIDNGVEPFYRLGVTIENCAGSVGPVRVFPPKDFAKWARICEHIVRHYTRGWANGYHWKITYWEIWNEPENKDGNRPVLWQGTFRQYCELYEVTSKLLKSKYPEIKVGGYGACGFYSVYGDMGNPALHERYQFFTDCFDEFLAYVKEHDCPFDFFAYHVYDTFDNFMHYIDYPRKKLDAAGFAKTEISINEWMAYPAYAGSAKCAATIGAYLTAFQNGPVDTAMIYDGQCAISSFAPLFRRIDGEEPDKDHPYDQGIPRKGYYAMLYFNELYKLGTAVACDVGCPGVHAIAATDGKGNGAIFLANMTDGVVTPKIDAAGWRRGVTRITDDMRMDALSVNATLSPYAVALIRLRRGETARAASSTTGVFTE